MNGPSRRAFFFCATLLGCSGREQGVVPVRFSPPQVANGNPRPLGKAHVVWRREWRTSRDRTVCPTARLATDRAGNVYLPGTYWGRLVLPGAIREAASGEAILLRVDPRGVATPLPFSDGPDNEYRSIVDLSVSPNGDERITIAQSILRGLVWNRRGVTNAEMRLLGADHKLSIGDNAVLSVSGGGLTFVRGGVPVWGRSVHPESPLPGFLACAAYDGGHRIAVGGNAMGDGGDGGVAVLNLDGSVQYAHRFLDRSGVRVSDLGFDAEGGLWVLGTSLRREISGGVEKLLTVPTRPHHAEYLQDGFLRRYDRRGRAVLDLTFAAGVSFYATYLDASTGIAYFVATVRGGIPPYYVSAAGDITPVTLLVAVDRSGAVTVVDDVAGGREPGDGQVLAHGDTLTVALEHRLRDKPYSDCELVRYAFPPP